MQKARRKKKSNRAGSPGQLLKKVLGGQKLAGREDGLRNKRKWEDAANARAMQRAFVCSLQKYTRT